MKSNYYQIRDNIDTAKKTLMKFRIDYNSTAGPLTQKIIVLSGQIALLIKQDFPEIASILENAAKNLM